MSTWTTRAHELRQKQAQILAEILLDLDPNDPRTLQDARTYSSPAGHEKKLRGIPVTGVRGVGGTVEGTNPVQALMAKQPSDE